MTFINDYFFEGWMELDVSILLWHYFNSQTCQVHQFYNKGLFHLKKSMEETPLWHYLLRCHRLIVILNNFALSPHIWSNNNFFSRYILGKPLGNFFGKPQIIISTIAVRLIAKNVCHFIGRFCQ